MDTQEDGGPNCPLVGLLAPVPVPPPAPMATPVDLTTLTFGNNADPNLLALVRLFHTLIAHLQRRFRLLMWKSTPTTKGHQPWPKLQPWTPGCNLPQEPGQPTAWRPNPPKLQQGCPSPNPHHTARPHSSTARTPPPPSYANSAWKGLMVTSEAICQHQILEANGKAQVAFHFFHSLHLLLFLVFCSFVTVQSPSWVSSFGSSLVRLLYPAEDGKSTLSLISSSAGE